MTEQTQPTDAEIMDMAAKHQLKAYAQFAGAGDVWIEGEVAFARAVLAKWGTPAGAGEVVAVVGTDAGGVHLYYEGKYLGPQPSKKTVMLLKDLPLGTQLFTATQPNQAQAGAVPLTVQYPEGYGNPLAKIAYDAGWRAAERAHGIKGADHG